MFTQDAKMPRIFDSREQPRYTTNVLDLRLEKVSASETPHPRDGSGENGTFRARVCIRPRKLVLYTRDLWIPTTQPPPDTEYIFISWHWASFEYYGVNSDPIVPVRVADAAKTAALDAGVSAYWLDVQCVDTDREDSTSSDIYGMSDVVRGAQSVAILLPDGSLERRWAWSKRLWTLPEGLLAKGKLRVWTYGGTGLRKNEITRTELARDFLPTTETKPHHVAIRTLAAYFDGNLELSRLERLVTTIVALSGQESANYTEADMAYAFMGFMQTRIEPNEEDTLFQAMVRLLSLTSNHDSIVERLLAFSNPFHHDLKSLFRALLNLDDLGAYLWDIEPRCEVVGIGVDDGTIFLSNCKVLALNRGTLPASAPISRSSAFVTTRKAVVGATLVIAATFAVHDSAYGNPLLISAIIAGLSCVHFTRSFFCGRSLCDTPRQDVHIYDGVLTTTELKEAMNGSNCKCRNLANEHSTNVCGKYTEDDSTSHDTESMRTSFERQSRYAKELESRQYKGNQSSWINGATPISGGAGLFTIIDMERHTVSILRARRRPTVALFCGSEGGMSRAVMCSWDPTTRLLTKEAVMRLPYGAWDKAGTAGWLKVKLL